MNLHKVSVVPNFLHLRNDSKYASEIRAQIISGILLHLKNAILPFLSVHSTDIDFMLSLQPLLPNTICVPDSDARCYYLGKHLIYISITANSIKRFMGSCVPTQH